MAARRTRVGDMLKDRRLVSIFQRLYRSRLREMVAPDFPILLDYPVNASPRYGYGRPPHREILKILERNRVEYANRLSLFCGLRDSLARIPDELETVSLEPCWGPQRYFSSLDAVALYGMLVEFRPHRFVEIGSGYSTKFAHRAIRDHSLPTQITSIDPTPRAGIDQLCESVIRKPLEEVDLGVFEELRSRDILFVDSSHRTFSNSDVTTVFMDVLPRLREGVIVHFHDIFWPYDYPPEWADRFYSEQYLLGCYLLAGHLDLRVLLPNAFVVHDPELAGICNPLQEIPGVQRPCDPVYSPFRIAGGSFWMQIDHDPAKKNGNPC